MRVLICIDPAPAQDGSCTNSAWVEQPTLADYLPTVAQGNELGFAFFASLFLAFAAARLLKPQ